MKKSLNQSWHKHLVATTAGYGIALASTALAAAMRWVLPDVLTPAPYLGFYPAVVVSAALGGIGPGIGSAVGSCLLVNLVFGHFDISDHGSIARQAIWLLASLGVSILAGMQRSARIAERRQTSELRRWQQQETEATLRLAESERRLRALGDQIPGGAIYQHVQTLDGQISYAYMSAGIEKIFGITPQSVLADPAAFRCLIHDEDRLRITDMEQRSAHQLTPFHGEFRQHTVTGELKWVQCQAMPRRTADGSILWDGIVVDVTERKRREELVARLTRLYAVLSQVNEAIVRAKDAGSLCQDVCRIVADIGGFPLAWIGLVEEQLVVPLASWGAAKDYLKQIKVEISGELGQGPTGTCIRKNKAVINDDFTVNPHTSIWSKDALRCGFRSSAAFPLQCGGKQIGALTLYAKEPSAFSDDQIGLLDSLSADLSYALDALAHEQHRKRDEERALLLSTITAQLLASEQPQRIVEEICRRALDHIGCQLFFNFLLDESEQRLHLNAWTGISAEAARQIEWLDLGVAVCGCVAQDGCRIVAENVQTGADPRTDLVRTYGVRAYACHPLMNQGKVVGTLSFGSQTKTKFDEFDLTTMRIIADHVAISMQRIRLLESARQFARDAEVANEAKSRFLAHISHELRTPMNAILGMIDVALPRVADATVVDCLTTARGSADLLLALLNDLLDSAKIEAGKLELENVPFSLRVMLEKIKRILTVRTSEKGLCFASSVSADTPDLVMGDRRRLQQILLNLAGNAVKFTERGAIEISLQATPGENQDICLEFAIRDTGIGIPAAALTRLFTRFVQSDASVARRFGGTGLGLSICKSLVELMDGRIWAVSEPGKGSTFFFTVQLARAAALPCETEGAVMVASPVAKLHVLLVEDNPANQKLATYILQDRGHEITIAGDGYEAIRLTEQHTFDVILMDVQMPGMNGLEATAAIRKREGGATRVPIIAMTAFAMEKDRERCLDAGMDGYLSKPISAAEMLAMVEKAAGGPAGEPATSDQICPPIAAAAKETSTIVFDPALALELCSGSQDAVQVFIENFFREQDTLLPEIDRALQKDDIAHIERLLHRLKGTLVYLGTPGVLAAVVHAEELCKDTASAHPKIAEAIQKVQENCQRLGAVLTGYSSTSAFN